MHEIFVKEEAFCFQEKVLDAEWEEEYLLDMSEICLF